MGGVGNIPIKYGGLVGINNITSAGAVDREFIYTLDPVGPQCRPIGFKLDPDWIKLGPNWAPL